LTFQHNGLGAKKTSPQILTRPKEPCPRRKKNPTFSLNFEELGPASDAARTPLAGTIPYIDAKGGLCPPSGLATTA
jgi:hypothetical protein